MILTPIMQVFFDRLLDRPDQTSRLQKFVGECLIIQATPFKFVLKVESTGKLKVIQQEEIMDSTTVSVINFPFYLLPTLLVSNFQPTPQFNVTGNIALVQALSAILQNAEWDLAEALSPIFGDVLAYRVDKSIKQALTMPSQFARRLLENVAEYSLEEQPMLAKPNKVADFLVKVDRLRDDTQRLEKRLARLQKIIEH